MVSVLKLFDLYSLSPKSLYISVALKLYMAHIEVYKIDGKKYRYEVTNYRVGKKVRHRKKYLGPVKPVYTKNRRD